MNEEQPFDLDSLPDSFLLDPIDVANILHVSPGTLSIWRCTGRWNLRFTKIGRKVTYKAGDVKAFIAKRTATNTADIGSHNAKARHDHTT